MKKIQLKHKVIGARLLKDEKINISKEISVSNENEVYNKDLEAELEAKFQEKLKIEVEKAYKKGLEAGKASIINQYQKKVDNGIVFFKSLADRLKKHYKKQIKLEETNLLELAVKISEKIVNTQISIDKNIILSVIEKSLKLLTEHNKIKIFVNPDEWEFVKENFKILNMQFEKPEDVEFISRNGISKGSCIIKTENGSIDGSIETQFSILKRNLLKNEKSD